MAPPKVVQKASVKSRLGPVRENGGAKKVFNGPKKTKRDSAEEKKLRKKLNRKQNRVKRRNERLAAQAKCRADLDQAKQEVERLRGQQGTSAARTDDNLLDSDEEANHPILVDPNSAHAQEEIRYLKRELATRSQSVRDEAANGRQILAKYDAQSAELIAARKKLAARDREEVESITAIVKYREYAQSLRDQLESNGIKPDQDEPITEPVTRGDASERMNCEEEPAKPTGGETK